MVRTTRDRAVLDNGVGVVAEPAGEASIGDDGEVDGRGATLVVAGVDGGLDGLVGVVSVVVDGWEWRNLVFSLIMLLSRYCIATVLARRICYCVVEPR